VAKFRVCNIYELFFDFVSLVFRTLSGSKMASCLVLFWRALNF
jgi:hypothetical protein